MLKFKYLCPLALIPTLLLSCKKDCDSNIEPTEKTATFQPGSNGKDAFVAFSALAPSSNDLNLGDTKTLDTYSWTSSGASIQGRGFISFPVDSIPSEAEIVSAKLSLFGVSSSIFTPQGNSGDNKLLIQRVIQTWQEGTITWNNQPATTTEFQMETTASTAQWNYDITNVDVTNQVKMMHAAGNNYGFCLRLLTEQIYRSIVYSSSEADDAAKRPKLVVIYKN